ncbi:hypothetical protein ACGLHS_16920 [Variovorax sp. VaC1]|uniref:hypothetical protein n=1 Tax=Variovorax sp. VaC1 TaxID=3373132 RepID=UPI0037486AB3
MSSIEHPCSTVCPDGVRRPLTRQSSVFRGLGICLPVTASADASAALAHYPDDSLGLPAGGRANVDCATQAGSGKAFYERLESNGCHFTSYAPRNIQ